jgi:hypothetical protein
MPSEKSSADLVNLFQQIAPTAPNIEPKKMFGILARSNRNVVSLCRDVK